MKTGTIWITGLSAAGKSTVSRLLVDELQKKGIKNVDLLDGEDLRARFTRSYGHSLEDRFAVLHEIIAVAKETCAKGNIAIVAAITPKKEMREIARDALGPFMEVYLKCSVEVCAQRDYKSLYTDASLSKEVYVAGVTEPFEETDAPELILDTGRLSIEDATSRLVERTLLFLRDDCGLMISES